jgi:hypothetical protein
MLKGLVTKSDLGDLDWNCANLVMMTGYYVWQDITEATPSSKRSVDVFVGIRPGTAVQDMAKPCRSVPKLGLPLAKVRSVVLL